MSELALLLDESERRPWKRPAWISVGLVCGFFVWAGFAPLEEVAIAPGEVVPQGKVKVIQHLEGGIIRQIYVEEGSQVAEGEPLLQLDLARAGISRNELEVQLDGLELKRARLRAEARGVPCEFPEEAAARREDQVGHERRAYRARQKELVSLVSMLHEQVSQRQRDVEELKARKSGTAAQLVLARDKLEMADDLVSEGLLSRMEHVQLKRDVAQLESDLTAFGSAIPRAVAALAEAREHEREQTLKFRRSAQEELADVELEIARLQEKLQEAVEQDERTEIRSPIAGTVKNLRYHTIGGVVRPGEPIMEVVPSDGSLVIDARLSPLDRGYVRVGQAATVKVSSYDFVRYGGLEGKVINLAADSDTDESHRPYFHVVVETDRSYLGTEESPLLITSGMQATVDIHTGEKSLLRYLVRPVLKLRYEAMRER